MPEIKSNLVSVYVVRDGQDGVEVLLLQRPQDHVFPGDWQAVHGHIEQGEAAWQTAARELREETSIEPLRWYRLLHIESFYNPGNDSLYLVPAFVAHAPPDAQCVVSDEHQAFQWCTLAEAHARFSWETQRQSIDALAGATAAWPQPGPGLMEMDIAALRRQAADTRVDHA